MFNEDYMGLDQEDNFDEEAYAKKLKRARMLGQPTEADAGDENIDMDMLLQLIGEDDKGGSGIRGGEDSPAEKEFKYGDAPYQIADDELMEGTHEQPGDIFKDSTDFEGQSNPDDFPNPSGDEDVSALEGFVGDKPKEITAEKVTIKKDDKKKKKSPIEKKLGKKYDEPLDLFGENGKQSKIGDKPSFGAEIEKGSLPWNEKGIEEGGDGLFPRGEGAGLSEALTPLLGAGAGAALRGNLAGKGISKIAKMFGGGAGKEAGSTAGKIMEKNAETAAKAGPKEGKFFQEYFGQKVPVAGKMGERANMFQEPGKMTSMPRGEMSKAIKGLLDQVKQGKVDPANLGKYLKKLGISDEDIMTIVGK